MITKKKKKKRPRDRIFTQPSKYFSILKILQYDYSSLSLQTPLHYESLRSKNPETIVISLDALLEHRTIVIVLSKHDNPLILLLDEIVSFNDHSRHASQFHTI